MRTNHYEPTTRFHFGTVRTFFIKFDFNCTRFYIILVRKLTDNLLCFVRYLIIKAVVGQIPTAVPDLPNSYTNSEYRHYRCQTGLNNNINSR